MSWARLDDRYDDNPKIKRAWKAHPAAIGLHVMAISYACRHELDGVIGRNWIEERLPKRREREQVLKVMLDCKLFEEHPEGFLVHDYLTFNPSREQLKERRERDRVRKVSERRPDLVPPDTPRTSTGHDSDSRTPAGAGWDGMGRSEVSTQGVQQSDARARIDEAISILTAVERWEVDEVGIENAHAMYPNVDLLQGARLAVTWASGSSWKVKSAAATLRAALKKLSTEAETRPAARRESPSELLRAIQGPA